MEYIKSRWQTLGFRTLRTALSLATLGLALWGSTAGETRAATSDGGWIPLFDGQSLNGWKASENPATFKVEGGQIVTDGPRAHLFFYGH